MNANREGNLRQRVPSQKSRAGCTACSRRRVRCSEEQPVCKLCLVYGTDCVRLPAVSQLTARKPQEPPKDYPKQILPRILSGTPADPFEALPVDMTYRSSEVYFHFVQDRKTFAEITRSDANLFTSGLGLTATDATWFQMMLCLTASYRHLQRYPNFQNTYLHHRHGLLQWLKVTLVSFNGAVSATYLSAISSMITIDSAAGDDISVEAHLKGIFSLLDARKRLEKDWNFYDTLIKQYTIMSLCIIHTVRLAQVTRRPDQTNVDPVLASMYTQMANEFLRVPALTGTPLSASRTDVPILVWLHKTLQEKRRTSLCQQESSARSKPKSHDGKEQQLWLIAVTAYALSIGTVDWFGLDRKERPCDGAASDDLRQLRVWWSALIEDWIASGKSMTIEIAQQIWKKLEWLGSDAGLEVVREIAARAQADVTLHEENLLEQYTKDMKGLMAAPGLLYI